MPSGVHVVHKFHRPDANAMELSFFAPTTVESLQERYGELLEEPMEIGPAGRSAVVRISTPLMDWKSPFGPQAAVFEACLEAAYRLRKLFDRARARD
jgi:hypothetical protein